MLLLHNAQFYTFDSNRPKASTIAIEGHRIIAVGDDLQPADFGPRATRLDLGGRVVTPGLTDAHIHLELYALNLQKVDCETTSYAECLRRITERADATPAGEWILGHGWNQNDWRDRQDFGTARDLDFAAPDHPVYLTAKSLHAAWTNNLALARASLNKLSPDPPGGRLGRDEKGDLNGILFEKAMELVSRAIPEPTIQQTAEAIAQAQPILWKTGLTGAHDFDKRRCFQALQLLHQSGELKIRVIKSIPLEDIHHAISLGLRSGFGDNTLRVGPVKAFADGALGPRTAAMISPYEGEPDNRGMLLLDSEELYEHGRLAVTHGLNLAVHAIGDRANHEVINAFAQLRDHERQLSSGMTPLAKYPLRHRIEHVQIIHPDDISRLGQLGVIASMQPIHATSDYPAAEHYWGRRSTTAYAWRSLLDYQTHVAFGSDAPVESPNPFFGLHAAVTRRRPDGSPGPEGWIPQQRISLFEAFQAYTIGAAYAANMEHQLGQLAPGFLADLLVMDDDPFSLEPGQLRTMHPLAIMIGGEWVHNELD